MSYIKKSDNHCRSKLLVWLIVLRAGRMCVKQITSSTSFIHFLVKSVHLKFQMSNRWYEFIVLSTLHPLLSKIILKHYLPWLVGFVYNVMTNITSLLFLFHCAKQLLLLMNRSCMSYQVPIILLAGQLDWGICGGHF